MTKKPKTDRFARLGIVVDIAMMALLAINVALLVVDAVFANITVQRALREHFPGAFALYNQRVHANFLLIDGVFLAVFVTEFSVRWAVAAARRTYHRWFFYPMIHWYDLLGCLPVSSLRFLRGLRLVAIVFRLHRLGRIDVRRYYLYRVFEKYKAVLTEEVSDRVVIHVLSSMQDDIARGSPIVERIWTEVVAPHKDEVLERVVVRADTLLEEQLERRRRDVGRYVERVLQRALRRSRHVFVDIERIPLLGKGFTDQIEQAIKTIVGEVVTELFEDAHRLDITQAAGTIERALAEAFTARDERVQETLRQVLVESLQIIKDQVAIQQWKVQELVEKGSAATPP